MRRRRSSLILTFSAVSLLAMVVLAVGLVIACTSLLRKQALTEGTRTAETYVQLKLDGNPRVVGPFTSTLKPKPESLVPLGLELGLVKDTAGNLAPVAGQQLLGLRLWSHDGELFWDTDASPAGFADGPRLDSVIGKNTAFAAVTHEVKTDNAKVVGDGVSVRGAPQPHTVLDVYVPIHDRRGGSVVGVAEVELDYADTEAALAHSVRIVAYVVVAGLGLLWLLLFRTVWNASRTLRRQAAETARLALLDPLTGLPNRRLLNERLERAAAASARTGDSVGLILLDIDRFKEVNDTLGHPRGDALLVEVARRLKEVVRDTDTVARLGGDEFAVLLPTTGGVAESAMIAGRVQGVFSQPFDLDGLILHVDTSVGYAALPEHAADVTSLLQRADVAMYTAKAVQGGPAVYTSAGDLNSPNRLILLGDLRRALDDDDQLCMHYQPKIDLRTNEVCGLEALLRWRHPLRGFIPPASSSRSPSRPASSSRSRTACCAWCRADRRVGRRGSAAPVAINLSARNLGEADLESFVTGLLTEFGVDAQLIEFEITESAIVEDPVQARLMLARSRRSASPSRWTTSASATRR